MGTKVWIMTPDQAQQFFELCMMKEAIKQDEREAVAESIVNGIVLDSSPDEVINQISQYAKVLQIKPTEKIQDSGNGLGNMLARVKQIGGEIKWSNDQGTQVLISISLYKILPRRKIFFNFARFFLL